MKIMPLIFTLILSLLSATHANAEETYRAISGSFSKHFDSNYDYNEVHNSVGVKMTTEGELFGSSYRVSDQVTYFKNSYSVDSVAYARSYTKCRSVLLEVCGGFAVGASTGYDSRFHSPVVPIGGLVLEVNYSSYGVEFLYIPPPGNVMAVQIQSVIDTEMFNDFSF